MKPNKTMGSILKEHRKKGLVIEDQPMEYVKQMEQPTLENISAVANEMADKPYYKDKDFYISINARYEKLLNEYNQVYFCRLSCPSPDFGQILYKVNHKNKTLEFIWVIPLKNNYKSIVKDLAFNLNHINEGQRKLAKFCALMQSGELMKWCKIANNEKFDDRDGLYLKLNNPTEEIVC